MSVVMRRCIGGAGIFSVLLGAAIGLAACAPFGGATPTVAPAATVAAITVPSATGTSVPPTVAPLAATLAPTAGSTTVPPVATTQPATVTATAAPPTATVPPAVSPTPSATIPPLSPTAGPPPTAPLVPTGVVGSTATDAQGLCAVTLPAGFAASGGAGVYSGADDRATVTLTALPMQAGDTLDDVALPFVSTFTAAIGDYQQTGVTRGADSLRLDFTGRTAAPGQGTIFLRQFGGTTCALSFFAAQGSGIAYEPTVGLLIGSLRPAGSIGRVRESA